MHLFKLPVLFAKLCVALGLFFAVVLIGAYFLFASPPSDFSTQVEITVERGQGALSIARELQIHGVVKSAKITANLITYLDGERKIKAGLYIFKKPESVFVVANRIVRGDFGYTPVKITVPEGTNYWQLANIIHAKFDSIATSTLEAELKPLEGYLFPDTYFFPPSATDKEIIAKLQNTFRSKIEAFVEKIQSKGLTLGEVLIMASILEEEVQTTEDRKMVADLLFRRIKMGMPLQVDATLGYVTGKGSAELTSTDLKSSDPYNTYTNKGLPPTPISNPGLDTIRAVLDPIPNDYLFYLSDKSGITHFARTHEEHVKNKRTYLR